MSSAKGRKQPSLFTYAIGIAIPIGIVVLVASWLFGNRLLYSAVESELRDHVEDIAAR